MDYFMPSEIARIVLGYLKENSYLKTYTCFMKECPLLHEYYNLVKAGRQPNIIHAHLNLLVILDEWGQFKQNQKELVNSTSHGSLNRSQTSSPDESLICDNDVTQSSRNKFGSDKKGRRSRLSGSDKSQRNRRRPSKSNDEPAVGKEKTNSQSLLQTSPVKRAIVCSPRKKSIESKAASPIKSSSTVSVSKLSPVKPSIQMKTTNQNPEVAVQDPPLMYSKETKVENVVSNSVNAEVENIPKEKEDTDIERKVTNSQNENEDNKVDNCDELSTADKENPSESPPLSESPSGSSANSSKESQGSVETASMSADLVTPRKADPSTVAAVLDTLITPVKLFQADNASTNNAASRRKKPKTPRKRLSDVNIPPTSTATLTSKAIEDPIFLQILSDTRLHEKLAETCNKVSGQLKLSHSGNESSLKGVIVTKETSDKPISAQHSAELVTITGSKSLEEILDTDTNFAADILTEKLDMSDPVYESLFRLFSTDREAFLKKERDKSEAEMQAEIEEMDRSIHELENANLASLATIAAQEQVFSPTGSHHSVYHSDINPCSHCSPSTPITHCDHFSNPSTPIQLSSPHSQHNLHSTPHGPGTVHLHRGHSLHQSDTAIANIIQNCSPLVKADLHPGSPRMAQKKGSQAKKQLLQQPVVTHWNSEIQARYGTNTGAATTNITDIGIEHPETAGYLHLLNEAIDQYNGGLIPQTNNLFPSTAPCSTIDNTIGCISLPRPEPVTTVSRRHGQGIGKGRKRRPAKRKGKKKDTFPTLKGLLGKRTHSLLTPTFVPLSFSPEKKFEPSQELRITSPGGSQIAVPLLDCQDIGGGDNTSNTVSIFDKDLKPVSQLSASQSVCNIPAESIGHEQAAQSVTTVPVFTNILPSPAVVTPAVVTNQEVQSDSNCNIRRSSRLNKKPPLGSKNDSNSAGNVDTQKSDGDLIDLLPGEKYTATPISLPSEFGFINKAHVRSLNFGVNAEEPTVDGFRKICPKPKSPVKPQVIVVHTNTFLTTPTTSESAQSPKKRKMLPKLNAKDKDDKSDNTDTESTSTKITRQSSKNKTTRSGNKKDKDDDTSSESESNKPPAKQKSKVSDKAGSNTRSRNRTKKTGEKLKVRFPMKKSKDNQQGVKTNLFALKKQSKQEVNEECNSTDNSNSTDDLPLSQLKQKRYESDNVESETTDLDLSSDVSPVVPNTPKRNKKVIDETDESFTPSKEEMLEKVGLTPTKSLLLITPMKSPILSPLAKTCSSSKSTTPFTRGKLKSMEKALRSAGERTSPRKSPKSTLRKNTPAKKLFTSPLKVDPNYSKPEPDANKFNDVSKRVENIIKRIKRNNPGFTLGENGIESSCELIVPNENKEVHTVPNENTEVHNLPNENNKVHITEHNSENDQKDKLVARKTENINKSKDVAEKATDEKITENYDKDLKDKQVSGKTEKDKDDAEKARDETTDVTQKALNIKKEVTSGKTDNHKSEKAENNETDKLVDELAKIGNKDKDLTENVKSENVEKHVTEETSDKKDKPKKFQRKTAPNRSNQSKTLKGTKKKCSANIVDRDKKAVNDKATDLKDESTAEIDTIVTELAVGNLEENVTEQDPEEVALSVNFLVDLMNNDNPTGDIDINTNEDNPTADVFFTQSGEMCENYAPSEQAIVDVDDQVVNLSAVNLEETQNAVVKLEQSSITNTTVDAVEEPNVTVSSIETGTTLKNKPLDLDAVAPNKSSPDKSVGHLNETNYIIKNLEEMKATVNTSIIQIHPETKTQPESDTCNSQEKNAQAQSVLGQFQANSDNVSSHTNIHPSEPSHTHEPLKEKQKHKKHKHKHERTESGDREDSEHRRKHKSKHKHHDTSKGEDKSKHKHKHKSKHRHKHKDSSIKEIQGSKQVTDNLKLGEQGKNVEGHVSTGLGQLASGALTDTSMNTSVNTPTEMNSSGTNPIESNTTGIHPTTSREKPREKNRSHEKRSHKHRHRDREHRKREKGEKRQREEEEEIENEAKRQKIEPAAVPVNLADLNIEDALSKLYR